MIISLRNLSPQQIIKMSKQKSNLNLCSLIALFHFILFFTSPLFFSCVLRDSTPHFVGPSVRPLVRHTLLFWRLWGFWLNRSCPNAPLTSIMAPAHPHATGVAVYLALFFLNKAMLSHVMYKESAKKASVQYDSINTISLCVLDSYS